MVWIVVVNAISDAFTADGSIYFLEFQRAIWPISSSVSFHCSAVGYEDSNGGEQTLVEALNGSSWAVIPNPSPGWGNNYLEAVSCASANKRACPPPAVQPLAPQSGDSEANEEHTARSRHPRPLAVGTRKTPSSIPPSLTVRGGSATLAAESYPTWAKWGHDLELRSAKALRLAARLLLVPLLNTGSVLTAAGAGAAVQLPAPGRIPQQASSACPVAPVKAPDGYEVSTYVSKLPFDGYQVDENFGVAAGMCISPFGLAFSGTTAYVATSGSPGGLYRFGLTGGTAGAAHEVIAQPFLGGPVFDHGRLYIIENYADPQHASVAQISPTTGQVLKTVATGLDCPQYLAVDPLNSDLRT